MTLSYNRVGLGSQWALPSREPAWASARRGQLSCEPSMEKEAARHRCEAGALQATTQHVPFLRWEELGIGQGP